MNKVEQVARAIALENAKRNERDGTLQRDGFEWFVNKTWSRHIDDARAAIEAMRVPTEAMIGAGRVVLLEGERKTIETVTAMIDAALEEGK